MRTLTVIIVLFIVGCCDPGPEPQPPYGQPSRIERDLRGEGYQVMRFVYSRGVKELYVVYVREDTCSDYVWFTEYER